VSSQLVDIRTVLQYGVQGLEHNLAFVLFVRVVVMLAVPNTNAQKTCCAGWAKLKKERKRGHGQTSDLLCAHIILACH